MFITLYHLVLYVSLILAISTEGVVLAHLGLIFISLKTTDTEIIFMFLLTIHIFSLQSVCSDHC